VNLKVRAEVNGADYWGVFFEMMERVKKAISREGISIPYPQRDVHLSQPSA
jgi:small conductance mechanosensitive channel